MAVFETWLTNDLQKIPKVEILYGVFFTQDSQGNKLGVVVTNGGQAATLTGTVMGYIIRADDYTVTVQGNSDGNRAWIIMPPQAYYVEGEINVVIRLENGTEKTTLCALRTTVHRTSTDSIVDPGHLIPSLSDLLEKIDEMEAGTAAANEAAGKILRLTASASSLSAGSNATATVTTVGSGDNTHFNIAFGIPQSLEDQAITNAEIDTIVA